jgi:hypothetical protein
MGLRDRAAGEPVAVYGGVVLCKDSIKHRHEQHPLAYTVARIETGAALAARLTTKQLVALGADNFADKKKHGDEVYLTVQSPEFLWTIEVEPKDQWKAEAFAEKVNETAGTEA